MSVYRPFSSVTPEDPRPGFGLFWSPSGWKLTTAFLYGLPLSLTTPETGTMVREPLLQPAAVSAARAAAAATTRFMVHLRGVIGCPPPRCRQSSPSPPGY